MEGREVLIKAVAQATATYMLNVVKIPLSLRLESCLGETGF